MISRLTSALLLALFLALPACAEDPSLVLQGTVTQVYDGDTLSVKKIGKVRLIGIDAPEREDSQRDRYLEKQGVSASRQREIYHAAKNYNLEHVKGQTVTLSLDQTERDKYGRLLAYVHLPDGAILNQVLIEKGLAVVYRKFPFRKKEDFLAAERVARETKAGLWADVPGH